MAAVADNEDLAEDGAAKKGKGKLGKKKLIIIAAAAVVLLGGAGAGAFLMMGGGEHAAEGEGGEHGAEAAAKPATYIDLPEVTVNLATPSDRPQYLKLKVSLEVSDERLPEQIQPQMARVLDAFQIYLREMRPQDLEGTAGMYRLKEELLKRINTAIYPAKIDAVLFKELLLQ